MSGRPTRDTDRSATADSTGNRAQPRDPVDGLSTSLLRRSIYGILIAVAAGGMVGRILAVNAVDKIALEKDLEKRGRADFQKQRPFLSGNDRSRWCTVRALVEHGTYAIDDIIAHWEQIKQAEKSRGAAVDGVALSQPALAQVAKLLHRVARAGRTVDFTPADPLGAALFALVVQAHEEGKDAEAALRAAALSYMDAVRRAE